MPFVTIKPKFQVTIPAKLREQIALHEGDVLDAVLVREGILLRPRVAMDKQAAADQLKSVFSQAPDDPRAEPFIVQEAIDDIAAHRTPTRG